MFPLWLLTVTPRCWSRFARERCAECNWSHRRRGFHQFQQPELLGPAACCLRQDHCSWDRKYSCGGHCPWCWWWWQAAGSGTGSPQCPCVGFLGEAVHEGGYCSPLGGTLLSVYGGWGEATRRRETIGNLCGELPNFLMMLREQWWK